MLNWAVFTGFLQEVYFSVEWSELELTLCSEGMWGPRVVGWFHVSFTNDPLLEKN